MALRDRIIHMMEYTLTPSSLEYVAVAFLLLTVARISMDQGKQKRMLELLDSKYFVVGMAVVALWSYLTLGFNPVTPTDFRMRLATKRALFALATVFLAEMHFTLLPFWLFWVASYYMDLGG